MLVIVGLCLALYGAGAVERFVIVTGVFLLMIGLIALGHEVAK